MKYKDIPRKKFTPKQIELLEKLHYVHVYVGKVSFENGLNIKISKMNMLKRHLWN